MAHLLNFYCVKGGQLVSNWTLEVKKTSANMHKIIPVIFIFDLETPFRLSIWFWSYL